MQEEVLAVINPSIERIKKIKKIQIQNSSIHLTKDGFNDFNVEIVL